MEEAKAMAQLQQQHQLMQQRHQQQQQQQNQQLEQHQQQNQQQQQQQQQHLLLLQQLQQQKLQQQQAMSRFPSNIDAHLRPPSINRSINLQQQLQKPNPNLQQQQQPQQQNPNLNVQQLQHQLQKQQQQQQNEIRPGNQADLQMSYQDAWRVCHPDFKRPFSSLEDACERLLPYHVVADYEAEEDDRILDADTTGQMPSRSQQWDHNIAAKVSEFLVTFEKQALAFNIISHKRATGEFRGEERLMLEQALLQEEKRAIFELRTEMEKVGREAHEAKIRMAAMAQAEQVRAESRACGPIRANAVGSLGNDGLGDHGVNEEDVVMNGWVNNNNNNGQRDEEPTEDFLNDDDAENGDDAGMEDEWREVGEFDLNTRGAFGS